MINRHLFLVGYDIGSPKRLRKALQAVRVHALGGQKSFYECWLTAGELQEVMQRLRQILDLDKDRAIFVHLRADAQTLTLGAAQLAKADDCIVLS